MNKNNGHNKFNPLFWDKYLLLAAIVIMVGVFILLNRTANGFFPDARLYPYVMTIIGLAVALLSIVRVLLNKEPNMDAQNGKEWHESPEKIQDSYLKTLAYLLVFIVFYLGIWLLGFRVASALFVFMFIRHFKHSYLQSIIFTLCGVALVEFLKRILNLEFPNALIADFLPK